MTRAQREITGTFPEIARALAAQHHGDLVVDGEIVAFDGRQTRFGRLQRSRVGFGALLLGYYDRDGELVYAGKVGTGFDNKTLRSLHGRLAGLERGQPAFRRGHLLPRRGVHWVEPRLVGQVGFTEWTDDGQLRHPRFQGLRDDKKPADVVREGG